MSSTYRVLCLSHDPALVLEPEWHSNEDGRARAEWAAAHPAQVDGLKDHAACDLLIGEYSYPLVAVGCPAPANTSEHRYSHKGPCWIDVNWLRLLHYAQQSAASEAQAMAQRAPSCWRPTRLARIAHEMGVPLLGHESPG